MVVLCPEHARVVAGAGWSKRQAREYLASKLTCLESPDDLLLIANDPGANDWLPGIRCASDVRPGVGSLGGIHAALVRAGGPVLVVAWDMPFVPAELLRDLRALGGDADVAAPESGSRRGVEPLCAYYGPGCVGPIERRLELTDA